MERYNQLRTNPDYIALQDEITLVDVRINTLLSSIEHKGSGIQIRRLKIEFDRMRLGLKLNNAVMANEAVITMQNVFDEALAEMFAWEEITRLIELRRRLSSTEQERIVQAQAILTSEEVMAFVGRLSAVLRANVKDDRALSVIAGEIRNLTHAVDPNRALLEANV